MLDDGTEDAHKNHVVLPTKKAEAPQVMCKAGGNGVGKEYKDKGMEHVFAIVKNMIKGERYFQFAKRG